MSLTLATGDTITGVAGAATSITYTIFGDEIAAGADTFKVLAQGQLPNAIATIYTVPAATATLVKNVHLVNGTAGTVTAALSVKGTAAANQILPPISLLAGGFAILADDGWRVYNAQGQLLSVGATGANGAAGANGLATSGVPAVVLSTTAAAGVAATALATDAQIIAFDVTAPVTQAYSDAAATGAAAVAARRDHKHGMPAAGGASGGTPAVVLGTAAAAGVAATFVRDDDTIIAFDVTVPVTQAYSDAAAAGVAAVAARRDHKHGMPAAGGLPLTTKGDVQGFSTVAARIPVGADTQVLTADSAQVLGVKWAAGGGGGSNALAFVYIATIAR